MKFFAALIALAMASATPAFADHHAEGGMEKKRSKQEIMQDLAKRLADSNGGGLIMTEEERRVALANTHLMAPVRTLSPSKNVYPLATDLTPERADIEYTFEGETFTVGSFLERHELMGIVVVEGDTIRLEQYAEDHGPEVR